MTDPEFANWLPRHLADTYGVKAEGVTRPQSHNPFVLRVDHDSGPPWVARAFGPHRAPERTRGDAEILRLLEDRGFPAERCAHHDPVSIARDHTILVTLFVDGTPPPTSKSSLRELGDLLGKLHAIDELTGAATRDAGSWHGSSEGLPAADLTAGLAMLDEVADRVPPNQTPVLERLREQVATADPCSDLPAHSFTPTPALSTLCVRRRA